MELQVKNRTILGKKVEHLRQQGFIPAELFGHGIENEHLSVSVKDFLKIYKSACETSLIDLVTEAGQKLPVFIADIQRHPISGEFLAIDFHQVKMDEKIKAEVPVEFTGQSPAVKAGGVLIKAVNELEVEALPQDMPPKLKVNLEILETIHQSIHLKDLKTPKGVKIIADPETVIATVVEPSKVEEAVVPPPPVAEPAAPEAATEDESEKNK
jgi:large subunit ribosomal protein L25